MAFKFKAVPWLLVLAALRVLYEHWQRVEERDRKRVTEILVKSRGLPHKMAQHERRDLVDIAKRARPHRPRPRPGGRRLAVPGPGPEVEEDVQALSASARPRPRRGAT